jgi:four helix bundle protein
MGGTYEDLEVWQASMDLVVKIYAASRSFPADERYGLTSQL